MKIDFSLKQLEEALTKCSSERAAAESLNISRATFLNMLNKLRGLCIQCKKVTPKNGCTRCEECLKKAKSKRSKEEKSEYNRIYREKNRERLNAYNKEYQRVNLDLFRKTRQKWDQTPLGKVSAARRRARRKNIEDECMPVVDLHLLKKSINFCEACFQTPDVLAFDHHIPLSKGGKLLLENTNRLCINCNSKKIDKMPEDFFSKEALNRINEKFKNFEKYKSCSSPKEYKIDKINPRLAKNFIKELHYTKTAPPVVRYAFSINFEERVLGVATFSLPAINGSVLPGVDKVLELSRLFILDGTPKNTESYFLGFCLKWLQKNTDFEGIITFADTTEGHTGGVYKACNFELLGETNISYHYRDSENRRFHKRTVWDRARRLGLTEDEYVTLEQLEKVLERPKIKFGYKF